MKMKKIKISKSAVIISLAAVICALLYCFNECVREIVNIIFISFALAYTLNPIKDFFVNRFKINEKLSSVIVIFIILGVIAAGIIMLFPTLIDEMTAMGDLSLAAEKFYYNIAEKLNIKDMGFVNSLYNTIVEKSNSIMQSFSIHFLDYALTVTSKIMSFVVIPVLIYYFMSEGREIFSKILLIVPTDKREVTENIALDINKVLKRYISSQLYLCGIIGVLTFCLLACLKVKFALWIAVINALFNIIPYFGAIIGMVPAIAVGFLSSPSKALWVAVGMFAIQQLEGNIISPKLTGDSTEMHPFVIIILILIGDKLGGFIGMIIVIPVAVIIKVLYDDINYYLY